MLANKLALSLPSINKVGDVVPFDPIDESSLLAWYKNKTGIIESIGRVSDWDDSSTNNYAMQQPTAIERPAYDASTGKLTFNPSSDQSLESESAISIAHDFTIGFKINVGTSGEGTVLASNTISDRYISIKSASTILLLQTSSGIEYSLSLDFAQTFTNANVVLSRDSSNLVRIYINGNLQADKATISGNLEINAIGIRSATNTLPFDGWMSEIQIYNSTSSTLISNVNTYLSNI